MFIPMLTIIGLWIACGLMVLSVYMDIASTDSNPLWYGLVFIFWPIAIMVGLSSVFVVWIGKVKEYYKKKGENRN